MTILSDLKILHHPDRIEAFQTDKCVYPVQISIDPVAACNHDCVFCRYHSDYSNPFNANLNLSDVLPFPKIIEILDDCVEMGIYAVEFSGGGEPSLHPKFVEILTAVCDRKLEIGLITNGCGVNWERYADNMANLLANTAQWVRFSIDAATAETHQIVHKGQSHDFETLCNSVRLAADKDFTVGFSFVVQRENAHEIRDAAILSHELGCDYIRFAAYMPTDIASSSEATAYYSDDFIEQIQEQLALIPSQIQAFNDFSARSAIHENYGSYEKGDYCFYSDLAPLIGADLRVYPCCIWKYHPDAVIGSLEDQSFKTLWESDARQKMFEKLDISERCLSCFLKPKNDAIKYITSPNQAEHLNFI